MSCELISATQPSAEYRGDNSGDKSVCGMYNLSLPQFRMGPAGCAKIAE